jgi:glutamyl-tRNA synthetase
MTQRDEDLASSYSRISIDLTKFDLIKIVSLIKERANFVSEFWEMSDFFVAPLEYDAKASKNWKEETTL